MFEQKTGRDCRDPAETANLLEAALRTGGLATWETDFATGTRTWTLGAAEILGLNVDTGIPVLFSEKDHLYDAMHPDDRHLLEAYRDELLKSDEIEVAYRIRREDTGIRYLAGRGRVMERNITGVPVRTVHIISDVTARHEAEENNKILMRELSHRTKNLMTVVSAMARQTARGAESVDAFQAAFGNRLDGLARSLNLLVAQDWSPAPVSDLITSQLETFAGPESGRLKLDGPALSVDASFAQSVGMALHELATNAMKYGALSNAEGYINVSWTVQSDKEGQKRLRFRWSEHDGPPVKAAGRKGFGSTVLEAMIAGSLDAEVTFEMLPTGVLWEFDAPLS